MYHFSKNSSKVSSFVSFSYCFAFKNDINRFFSFFFGWALRLSFVSIFFFFLSLFFIPPSFSFTPFRPLSFFSLFFIPLIPIYSLSSFLFPFFSLFFIL